MVNNISSWNIFILNFIYFNRIPQIMFMVIRVFHWISCYANDKLQTIVVIMLFLLNRLCNKWKKDLLLFLNNWSLQSTTQPNQIHNIDRFYFGIYWMALSFFCAILYTQQALELLFRYIIEILIKLWLYCNKTLL